MTSPPISPRSSTPSSSCNRRRRPNLLDQLFKCAFTHPYSRKENLNKLRLLEELLTKSKVSILSALLDSGEVHLSIDGLVDFFAVDLKKHVQLDSVEQTKVQLAADFSSLQVLVPYALANSQEVKLTILGLDLLPLKSSLPEILRLMIRAAYFREIAVNLRFCYEKMRMSFQDIQRKIKGFLMELDLEEDPMILYRLKQFVVTGTQNEKINEFFKNLSVKKIGEIRESVGNFVRDVRALLLDTFKIGLSRMMVLLSFMKSARPGLFDSLEDLVRGAYFVLDSIVSKTLAKEIQIRNFFIFLYRSKLKTISPKKVCEYEDEALSSERLDHHQLLALLKSKESLYMKDLLEAIEKTRLRPASPQQHSPTIRESLSQGSAGDVLDEEFQALMTDLDIDISLGDLDNMGSQGNPPASSEVSVMPQ